MSVTALSIIKNAFANCGLVASEETLEPAQAQDGLSRLNRMVQSWRTQYQTVLSIDRYVFPLVASQQAYGIGPGGQFNVARPLKIDNCGLLLNGLGAAVSVTSITRSSFTATVTQTTHGYEVGDQINIDGADELDYNGLQTVVSVPTGNTWTFVVDGSPVSPASGTLTASPLNDQPVEVTGRVLLTDSAYQAIQLKTLTNSQFTNVYYQTSFPLGTVWLWPIPNTAENQLVLYLQQAFLGFSSLSRQYDYPDVPGYAEALEYGLARRLLAPYGVKDPAIVGDVMTMAAESLGMIKRANNRLNDLPTDAQVLTRNRRGWYNLNTGQGG